MATEQDNIGVRIVAPGSEESDFNCSLEWEIEEDDNGGQTTYYPGTSYYIRLWKGTDIKNVSAFNTNGIISLITSSKTALVGEGDDPEYLNFENQRTLDLEYPYWSDFTSEQVGSAYDKDGNEISVSLTPPEQLGSVVSANQECYAVFRVSYYAVYDEYQFNCESGTAIIVANADCGDEEILATIEVQAISASSSSVSCSSSSSISSAILETSITLVYTDFVTGSPIIGAAVIVDGANAGVTNNLGEILIEGVTINEIHEVSATCDGYLNTDSDGLSNDRFMITLDE